MKHRLNASAITARIRAVHFHSTYRYLMQSGIGQSVTLTGQRPDRLDWIPADREPVEPKQQFSPEWACPSWHGGQAGHKYGPCPDA